jgi:signal peptidase II
MDAPSTPPPVPGRSVADGGPAVAGPGSDERRGAQGIGVWTLVTAALVLAVDQLTKWWVVGHLDRPFHVVWTLRLVRAYNTGTAFSLGSGLGPFIGLLAVAVVIVVVRVGRTVVSPVGMVALGLVLGGALGNLTDRLLRDGHGFLHGAVVDFIDLQWWPIFNVADSAIVIGGLLLVVSGFGQPVRRSSRRAVETASPR